MHSELYLMTELDLIVLCCFSGRILVATRSMRRGELIFRESPAITGPYSRTRPQCLTCLTIFPPGHVFTCPR